MHKLILSVLLLAATGFKSGLSPNARQVLDRNFPGWHLLKVAGLPDSINMDSVYRFSNFYECDLNGDNVPDYALAISTRSDSIVDQHFLALVSEDSGYTIFRLVEFSVPKTEVGRVALTLQRKGSRIPDFTRADEFDPIEEPDSLMVTFETDAITYLPLDGCCSSTFVFQNGKFRGFDSSD